MSRIDAQQLTIECNSARVLLVEDNRVGRLVAERLMQRWGYQVHLAGNGLEALKLAALNSFDLILMNVQMPELNGWDTAMLIRRLGNGYQHVPILALSADPLQSHQLNGPFTDFLEVPYMPEQLQHLLQQHLQTAAIPMAPAQLRGRLDEVCGSDPMFRKQLITLFILNLRELLDDVRLGRLDSLEYLQFVRHKHKSSLRLLDLYSLEGALDNLQQALEQPAPDLLMLQQRKNTLVQQADAVLEELRLLPIER